MMSNGFAVGAALLAGLIPWVARADVLPTLTLYPAVGAAIISSGPTNFIGITGTDFTGDACWNSPAGTN
jgi:hypothetical protein